MALIYRNAVLQIIISWSIERVAKINGMSCTSIGVSRRNVWRGKGGGGIAIQQSTVVQDQLKILYGVCIAHIQEGL